MQKEAYIEHPILQTDTWCEVKNGDIEIIGLPTVKLTDENWETFAAAAAGYDRETQINQIMWFDIVTTNEREFLTKNRLTIDGMNQGRYGGNVEPTIRHYMALWNKRLGLTWYQLSAEVMEVEDKSCSQTDHRISSQESPGKGETGKNKDEVELAFEQLVTALKSANATMTSRSEAADDYPIELESSRKRAAYHVMIKTVQALCENYQTYKLN